MRFAPTPDEIAAMRPLIDLIEERIAQRLGQTLEQYRAEKAAAIQQLLQPRKLP